MLIRVLGAHEQDLQDLVFELLRPRDLTTCQRELPANPGGSPAVFAVAVPIGTVQVDADAFTDCAGLAQVTLPATVAMIEAGGFSYRSDNDDDDEDEDEAEAEGGYAVFDGCPGTPQCYIK